MPSIIPGFEYDVFISYRQKDNKGDKWVTEFVNALRTELDATFKEDVSIYFDENPHDGLLEIHDVDESLREKLKCLIFIPIISQTYCDPKCFAWQSEFIAFKRYASTDKFGLKVRVSNGNVTSRILPVRIHDLDSADRKLLESEIGQLRSIDLIFKSAGVNRPLRAKDDELKDANRQILYRDQINKLANAMKEIIQGLRNSPEEIVQEKQLPKIGGALFNELGNIPKIKSLAVLPFVNNSNDESLNYLSEGVSDSIISLLSQVRELKMASKVFQTQLHSNSGDTEELARKYGISLFLKGQLINVNQDLAFKISLFNTEQRTELWTAEFDLRNHPIVSLPNSIAEVVVSTLGIVLKENEKNILSHVSEYNSKAYEEFLKGKYYLKKAGDNLFTSLEYFQQAMKHDPGFAAAMAAYASNLLLLSILGKLPYEESLKKAKQACFKALAKDTSLLEAYHALAFIAMSYEWSWQEAEHVFKKVYALNPSNPRSAKLFELYLNKIKAILEEAEAETVLTVPYFLKAFAYLHIGLFEESLIAAREAVDKEPDSFMAHRATGLSYMGLERYDLAAKSLETASRLSNRHPWILFELMGAYINAGKKEEARNILEESQADAHLIAHKISEYFKLADHL